MKNIQITKIKIKTEREDTASGWLCKQVNIRVCFEKITVQIFVTTHSLFKTLNCYFVGKNLKNN